MTMYCIYRITNNINGHTYIGQHKYTDESNPMGKYKGSGLNLHKAYKKYGIENFTTEILYSRIRDKETVNAMEIWAIVKYKPEYNIAKGGDGGDLGPEVRARISKAMKGKKQPWDHRYMLGKHHSEETKQKQSDALKGKKRPAFSEEWKLNISIGHKGIKYPERTAEHRKHLSESLKGHEPWNKGKSNIKNIGKHWYNNGTINVYSFECPDGFVPGRCKK